MVPSPTGAPPINLTGGAAHGGEAANRVIGNAFNSGTVNFNKNSGTDFVKLGLIVLAVGSLVYAVSRPKSSGRGR